MTDISKDLSDLLLRTGLTELDIRLMENHIIRSLEHRIRPLLKPIERITDIEKQIQEKTFNDPQIQYLKDIFETRLNCVNISISRLIDENNSLKQKIHELQAICFDDGEEENRLHAE